MWQFKRDQVPNDNADLTIVNSQLFKYKAALVGKKSDAVNNTNSSVKNTKIAFLLEYLSNFWRSFEMPLINFEIHHELNWIEDWILTSGGDTVKCKTTDVKLHVSIVISSTKGNLSLTNQISNEYKRSAYWNNYQAIPENISWKYILKIINQGTNIYELLSASFQGVKRLYILAYAIAANAANNEAVVKGNRKRFLPSEEIKIYNVLIDGRNFYDQPINDLIKTVWWSKKSINRTRWWLYYSMFIKFCIFQRQLQSNSSWLK